MVVGYLIHSLEMRGWFYRQNWSAASLVLFLLVSMYYIQCLHDVLGQALLEQRATVHSSKVHKLKLRWWIGKVSACICIREKDKKSVVFCKLSCCLLSGPSAARLLSTCMTMLRCHKDLQVETFFCIIVHCVLCYPYIQSLLTL